MKELVLIHKNDTLTNKNDSHDNVVHTDKAVGVNQAVSSGEISPKFDYGNKGSVVDPSELDDD